LNIATAVCHWKEWKRKMTEWRKRERERESERESVRMLRESERQRRYARGDLWCVGIPRCAGGVGGENERERERERERAIERESKRERERERVNHAWKPWLYQHCLAASPVQPCFEVAQAGSASGKKIRKKERKKERKFWIPNESSDRVLEKSKMYSVFEILFSWNV
jgi:hypothetical protein